MPHRLEITLKPELFDAEGEGIRHKAADYFDIRVDRIRTVQILTIDADLTAEPGSDHGRGPVGPGSC